MLCICGVEMKAVMRQRISRCVQFAPVVAATGAIIRTVFTSKSRVLSTTILRSSLQFSCHSGVSTVLSSSINLGDGGNVSLDFAVGDMLFIQQIYKEFHDVSSLLQSLRLLELSSELCLRQSLACF